jgi:hypothetical protein
MFGFGKKMGEDTKYTFAEYADGMKRSWRNGYAAAERALTTRLVVYLLPPATKPAIFAGSHAYSINDGYLRIFDCDGNNVATFASGAYTSVVREAVK